MSFGPVFPVLGPGKGVKAFEIEGQTDQAPLTSRGSGPAQRELAEAQHLFDDADDGFDGACACPIDCFAQSGFELVRHFDLGARVLGWRIRQGSKTL
jgi:hypothetical protein